MHTEGKLTIDRFNSIVTEKGKTLLVAAAISHPMATEPNDESVANAARIVKTWNMHDDLVDVLEEAKLQIVYLHGKFQETGTGNSVISRINNLLQQAKL